MKNFVIFHIFRFSRWPFWDYVTWDLQEGYLGKIGHWPICKNSHFYDPFKMSSPSIPGYWLIMSNHISAWAGDQVAGFRFITKYLASMMQRVDIKPKILILTIKILINPIFFFCLFYSINVKTAETIGPTFLWDLAWPPWMIKFTKICLYQNSIFRDFENPQFFL